ncbi:hypothetical protein SAMN05216411_1261 [Nitrosospira multiformis]|nr:hypothetical protein SAMN05216411_1261 [Nitrosospira multiformis]
MGRKFKNITRGLEQDCSLPHIRPLPNHQINGLYNLSELALLIFC